MLRRIIPVFLFLILLCSPVIAGSVETVEPQKIFNEVYLTDYGFGTEDDEGYLDEYFGYCLETDEAEHSEGKKALFYCVFENRGDTDESLVLYIRGGQKHDIHWAKRAMVKAHSSYVFLGDGLRTLGSYVGNWTVSVNGKYIVRYALYHE